MRFVLLKNKKEFLHYASSMGMQLHPFQQPDVIATVDSFLNNLCRKSRCEYAVALDEDVPVTIVPFRRFSGKTGIVIGVLEQFDFVDILYANKDDAVLKSGLQGCLQTIKESGISRLNMQCVDIHSRTCLYLSGYTLQENSVHRGVKISLDGLTYEEWFAALSKNCRQNIRTAYNRTKRDQIAIKIAEYNNCTDKGKSSDYIKILSECENVYLQRAYSKYCGSMWHKLRRTFLLKKLHYLSRSLRLGTGFIYALKFNDEVAAFISGYRNEMLKSLEVPMLAISRKYEFYSPGYILVSEMLRRMQNLGITTLNLCNGTEKYKLDLGGDIYSTRDFTILL